jgi:dephospho-CoA kinase
MINVATVIKSGGIAVGRWESKYVIGLTGNIATGKSLVRRMLEHLGAYTLDADGLAHQAMAPGAPAYKPVVTTFGTWILDAEHRIDRTKLGAVVFAHPEALNRLETITHPVVGQAIDTLIQRARHKVIVVEAIKLLESQIGSWVDAIWVVDAPEDQQIQRLAGRGLTAQEAAKRIRMQNPQAEKIARASVVIHNNGTPEQVWAQVQTAWSKIQGSAEDTAAHEVVQHVAIQQPTTAPATTPSGTVKVALTSFDIIRGMPKNADAIAQFINTHTGKSMSKQDVLMAFGQKSYMLAMANNTPVGLVGFLVENLVTRVDEFFVDKQVPTQPIVVALADAVENASKELQSEVGYIFLPETDPQSMAPTFLQHGYERQQMEEIKIPAWREAVRESRPNGTMILSKKLRAERVLKPL